MITLFGNVARYAAVIRQCTIVGASLQWSENLLDMQMCKKHSSINTVDFLFVKLLNKAGAAYFIDHAGVPEIFFGKFRGTGIVHFGYFEMNPDRLRVGTEILLETTRCLIIKVIHGGFVGVLKIPLQNF